MNDIQIVQIDELTDQDRASRLLLVLDENDIKNTTFKSLMGAARDAGIPAVVAMPEGQYRKGLRGWAKIKILASLIPTLEGVMPVTHEQLEAEMSKKWAKAYVPIKKNVEVKIAETRDNFEVSMIDKIQELLIGSNCWYIPAGSIIVREGQVLAEAVSTSFDRKNFNQIPLTVGELELTPGERLNFGETMHSEQLAVAKAAREGTKLVGATIYVSKFPCLPCAMTIIGAGIKKVVFEEDSYGLADTKVLVENGVELVRVVRSS